MKRCSLAHPVVVHMPAGECGPPEVYRKLKPLIERFGGDVPDLPYFDVLMYHERQGSLFIVRRGGLRCFAGVAVVGPAAVQDLWQTLIRLDAKTKDPVINEAQGTLPWIALKKIEICLRMTSSEYASMSRFTGELTLALLVYHRQREAG